MDPTPHNWEQMAGGCPWRIPGIDCQHFNTAEWNPGNTCLAIGEPCQSGRCAVFHFLDFRPHARCQKCDHPGAEAAGMRDV